MSDAVATAQILAARDAEAVSIIKEAEALKQARRHQDAAEKLRDILPLCSELPTPTIIRASQALDSILVRWETSSTEQGEVENGAETDTVSEEQKNRATWQHQCSEINRAIRNLKSQQSSAKYELWAFERKQEQVHIAGADFTRLQLKKKAADTQSQIDALQAQLDQLEANKSQSTSYRSSTRHSTTSSLSPWRRYVSLQSDFKEAALEAKLRDSKRR